MSPPKISASSEFSRHLRGWEQPVLLQGESIPTHLRGVPDELSYCVIVSGELMSSRPYSSPYLGETERIGGFYVVRHAPDDPVPFNRDDYFLVPSKRLPECLLVDGPYNHATEHWADEAGIARLVSLCIL